MKQVLEVLFFRKSIEDKTGAREGPEAALTTRGAAQALATPTCGEEPLVHSWRRPFVYKKPPDGKP
jgi:hypothetical protein